MLFLFWPIQAQEFASSFPNAATATILVPERFETIAETSYLDTLTRRGFKLDTQGFLIESLDGAAIYADYQSDVAFNPASVIKVATTFSALSSFGADHKFETSFFMDGELDKKTRVLKGDLILHATGDPNLSSTDITRLVRQVARAGITRVNGDLLVVGPLSFAGYYKVDRAVRRLAVVLNSMGIRITGAKTTGDEVRGTLIATHVSSTLREILLFQNAHSSNPIAERLGETLGGPRAVEQFLVEQVGIPQDEVFVGRTSGLQHNRITPKGTILLFRELVRWLEAHDMTPEDVLPVAGIDAGTLRTRFTTADYRGGVVAKTGTLPVTDGGVSTLAGIVYTRDRGPLLFAIFNTKGSVLRYRQLQDVFLKAFILESGGIPETNGSSRRLSN
jgi:D-alanyl-D-alanine carboxypeptidase/D-alanyl-D-alanine-endopeptidase (penicillin-binding protein 4)